LKKKIKNRMDWGKFGLFLLTVTALTAAIFAICASFSFGKRRGSRGRRGLRGATGDTGSEMSENSQKIVFSMQVQVPSPEQSTVFFPGTTSMNGPWDSNSTNGFPANYASTFLVPEDGVISDLIVRADVRSPSIDITPSFQFQVWESQNIGVGATGIGNAWSLTSLEATIPTFLVPASLTTSVSAIAEGATGMESNVTRGNLLTVVLTPTGYNMFDIQPGSFSATFSYTPL
jgi:hypothetical protein